MIMMIKSDTLLSGFFFQGIVKGVKLQKER